jgi:hypothetical protein
MNVPKVRNDQMKKHEDDSWLFKFLSSNRYFFGATTHCLSLFTCLIKNIGVVVGFATCLLFVFLTIPAAIAAKVLYDVSLADSDWLHGSAESLLTVTNLVTVVAFRQALNAKEQNLPDMPVSATSYEPMTWLVVGLTALAGLTAAVPALAGAGVHTPYLGGFMDLPTDLVTFSHTDPENSLTVAW